MGTVRMAFRGNLCMVKRMERKGGQPGPEYLRNVEKEGGQHLALRLAVPHTANQEVQPVLLENHMLLIGGDVIIIRTDSIVNQEEFHTRVLREEKR